MGKKFNITGTCVPEKHFMVDISRKIEKIMKFIEDENYFIINRPRQYGKTTTLFLLYKKLKNDESYLPIKISFEGVGDLIFEQEQSFSKDFLKMLATNLLVNNKSLAKFLDEEKDNVENISSLSNVITKLIIKADKKVVLMIDEVDKSSNNQLFLSFLGMLRNKYLLKNEGEDYTFHSVILAGVYDVKSLKLKLRPEEERKYNSPWNIAVDFDVDMSFSKEEIDTMLKDYVESKKVKLDNEYFSERLYYYTSGYPFLVSKLCKIIDEKVMKSDELEWKPEYLDTAVKEILKESNTNFEAIVTNLENSKELYEEVYNIVIEGAARTFNILNPLVNLGIIYGIFKENDRKISIHNRIFEQIIYNYMISKSELKGNMDRYNFRDNFIINNNELDFEKILLKYQQFMKEQYSSKDITFLEREGRLLFLAFLKPIINGVGFDFKEVQISQEKRLDVVVTYDKYKYVSELKIWHGEEYHKKGLVQLCDYLEVQGLNKGYLVIYNFNKNKEYKSDRVTINSKDIFMVWI